MVGVVNRNLECPSALFSGGFGNDRAKIVCRRGSVLVMSPENVARSGWSSR